MDMDAFFVSVELLRRPELRGRPVIVANGRSARSRGVVMTASYEARAFGVHSALSLAEAYRRCPDAVLVPSDSSLYRRASSAVMEILWEFSESVEQAGLDEAYLDLADSMAPKARAREMKLAVRERTGLTCSVGLGANKLCAKIASDLEKPDGLTVLEVEGFLDAVGERSVRVIPGVGPKTEERLTSLGIGTVNELASADAAVLSDALGDSHAVELQARSRGLDSREVAPRGASKSESRETTFDADIADPDALHAHAAELAESVCSSLRSKGREGRTVTVKAKTRSFRTMTRSLTLDTPTNDPRLVIDVARDLISRLEQDEPLRLIGVGLSGFTDAETGAGRQASLPLDGDLA